MEYWRVTEVWAIGSQGPGRVGSGYLISERRVLTARHVLAGILRDPGKCEVRCTGQTEWIPATLAWSNEDLDVALLELTGSLAGRAVEPVSWGRIVGDQPVDCTAVGFPDAQSRADQVRDTEQIDGRILPLSTVRANRLTVQVRGNAPTALASGDTPWHGMSGAAVFAADELVGVVVDVPPRFGTGRLIATPVSLLAADPTALQTLKDASLAFRLQAVPRPRHVRRLVALASVTAGAVVAALVVAFVMVSPPREVMDRDEKFNVAVARLAVQQTPASTGTNSPLAEAALGVSNAIARQIQGDSIRTWGPGQYKRLNEPISSESDAIERATALNAYILVYGTLHWDSQNAYVATHVLVNYPDALVTGNELALTSLSSAADGSYDMGDIRASGNVTASETARGELSERVSARALDVANIVRGVAEYNRGAQQLISGTSVDASTSFGRARSKFDDAQASLVQAKTQNGPPADELLALISHFRGATYVPAAVADAQATSPGSVECVVYGRADQSALDASACAEANYRAALCLLGEPSAACPAAGPAGTSQPPAAPTSALLARPHIGLGTLIFLPAASRTDAQGRLRPPTCPKVQQATAEYLRARDLAPESDPLLVRLKALLNAGIAQSAWERTNPFPCGGLSAEAELAEVASGTRALLEGPTTSSWNIARDLAVRSELHLGWLQEDKALLDRVARGNTQSASSRYAAAHAHFQQGLLLARSSRGHPLLPIDEFGPRVETTVDRPSQIEPLAIKQFFWGMAVKQARSLCEWANVEPRVRTPDAPEYRQADAAVQLVLDAAADGDGTVTARTRQEAAAAKADLGQGCTG